MRVAVTGASGYLASVLIPKLEKSAAVREVLALDVVRPGAPSARWRKVAFREADVRTADFATLFAGCDAVIHLAFVLTPREDLGSIYDISITGTERVFHGAARAGVKQIVYASSVAAYGCVPGHELPITEETPRKDQPEFYYSHTKYQVEEFIDRFERDHAGMAIARMRPGLFVGPGINNPAGLMLRSGVVVGISGSKPVQFTADDDVADAFVLALEKRAHGAFIVTNEDALSSEEVAAILGKPLVPVPDWMVAGGLRAARALGLTRISLPSRVWLGALRAPMNASSAKTRRELGWSPRYPSSRAALRYLAEHSPGVVPNPGIALFFGLLSVLSHATGGRVGPTESAHEIRAIETVVNVELTGPGGFGFRVKVDHGRLFIDFGLAPDASSTVRVPVATFVRLLAGELEPSTATFTGKVRIQGEGHAGFLFGGIVTLFRKMATARAGAGGLVGRSFAELVLRLARRGLPASPGGAPRTGEARAQGSREPRMAAEVNR